MSAIETTASGGWGWVSASAVGTSHAATGRRCQDRSIVAETDDGGTLIAVVCDGCGSARFGAVGAEFAAAWFMERTLDAFRKGAGITQTGIFEDGLRATAETLRDTAEHLGGCAGDYATTFLALIAGEDAACILHVGDGACALRSEDDDRWRVPSWPYEGEYAGMTRFLSDRDLVIETRTIEARIVEAALFTDGLERLALDFAARGAHAPFLDPMMRPIEPGGGLQEDLCGRLADFLASDRVNARTDDDKTLILARRAGAAG